jgi:hypothetical protein
MKKKYLFIILLIAQISIIGFLSNQLYTNTHVLGTISINPIQKDTLISSPNSKLKFFYEPKPNTILKPDSTFDGLEDVTYITNSDGLHQKENYAISKTPGTFRIVAIGDSFTAGSKIHTGDSYPSQLNTILNETLSCLTIKKFEVLNLGVGGYDMQYAVERFRLRGQKYNPDLVIWFLIPDDFTRINERFLQKADMYLQQSKRNENYEKEIVHGQFDREWHTAKNEVIAELGGMDNVLLLQEMYMQDISTYYSGKLLVVLFPLPSDKNRDLTLYKAFLEDFAHERKNTFFYDKLPNIYEQSDTYLPDSHPNKKGHGLIAKSMLQYLVNEKILPCSYE